MIVDFMLGTGMRIGETLAVTDEAVDLEAATVEIRATLVYDRQQRAWVIQPKPKTPKGSRKVHLPPWLVILLKAHETVPNPWGVTFPSQTATPIHNAHAPEIRNGLACTKDIVTALFCTSNPVIVS